MDSGCLKVSIPSWLYTLSVYCGCILILAWMSCSGKVLLERGLYIIIGLYCGLLRGAWRTTGSKGSDKSECLISNVYGFS